ncbi:venom protease-like [Macrobrachium rosenbergii]|uniref:venom protease-like n=1 Tax=Macrobrachium rosenbergii TaxID=79674 RepID=UPI0034D4261D
MQTIILFICLLCDAWAQDIFFEKIDTVCQLPGGGGEGRCIDQSQCPEAYANFPEVRPTICGFNRRIPVVCCPPETGSVGEVPPKIPENLRISPPKVDFGPARICGREWVNRLALLRGPYQPPLVLTAAHCFAYNISVVRLGEHDYNSLEDGAYPVTTDIEEKVIYPEYRFQEGYHDLALLKMSIVPFFTRFINPVCLPWESERNKNIIGDTISLTGWGATEFGGVGSSIIQEVNVTVFPTSVCDQSYSSLRDYELVWPRGIRETILCAGDPQGGKDACQGDSGGPVTYLNEEKKYVLAGVVSRGYGCGLSEFPGIYADVRHAPYLSWIKTVAFQ